MGYFVEEATGPVIPIVKPVLLGFGARLIHTDGVTQRVEVEKAIAKGNPAVAPIVSRSRVAECLQGVPLATRARLGAPGAASLVRLCIAAFVVRVGAA